MRLTTRPSAAYQIIAGLGWRGSTNATRATPSGTIATTRIAVEPPANDRPAPSVVTSEVERDLGTRAPAPEEREQATNVAPEERPERLGVGRGGDEQFPVATRVGPLHTPLLSKPRGL